MVYLCNPVTSWGDCVCAFALLDFLQLFNIQFLHIMRVLEASCCGIAPHQSLLGAAHAMLSIQCLIADSSSYRVWLLFMLEMMLLLDWFGPFWN